MTEPAATGSAATETAPPVPAAGELPILVVGGGVSGLSVAYFLQKAGKKVRLVEAGPRLGGNIRTETREGFLYDVGPDSFLRTKPEAKALCEELGLTDELIAPREEGAQVFVAYRGKLEPMPEGLALGVPTRPGALLSTALLSGAGKLRAMKEPFVAPRTDEEEESIQEFCTRRLGREMGERIAAPLLSGVFAGDASRLSMQATFPQLVLLEKKYGSLYAGMTGGKPVLTSALESTFKKKPKAQSPFLSLKGGLGRLIEALSSALKADTVELNVGVTALRPGPNGITAQLSNGEQIAACHVVLAGPPWSSSTLLENVDSDLSEELAGVRGCPTATVFFGLTESELQRPLAGSGFIVPQGEGDILAATWISSKWDGRAPQGSALVRAFVGGARTEGALDASDDELIEIARRELTRFMGDLGQPRFSAVYRYERGTPQPEIGHGARLKRVEERVRHLGWLSLIGSGFSGVGIPDCVRQAQETAGRIS